MTDPLIEFYNDLTPYYHLIYLDWEQSINRQGEALDSVIQNHWGRGISRVLDAACGIGTQSLGLASLGYRVTASDLSPGEVERAVKEAADRDLKINFSVGDMRRAHQVHGSGYDLVIACDNALPHLLTDGDILKGFRSFYDCLKPGGGLLISVRDYDGEERGGQSSKVYGSREEGEITYLIFQLWDWQDEYYDLSLYLIADDGSPEPITRVFRSRYYAVGIDRLIELMREAGFQDVKRLDGVYFQPLVVGTHPF